MRISRKIQHTDLRLKKTLRISEIFFSLQGESTFSGKPCIFIRLVGCNLRCSYCDSEYAFRGGNQLALVQVLEAIEKWPCPLVEITGGEPLLQKSSAILTELLLERGYQVLMETSGSESIRPLKREVIKILDLKCPGSGENHRICWANLALLSPQDEVKFVIGNREDYEWARSLVLGVLQDFEGGVLFSPVFAKMANKTLADWILADRLAVRFQLQTHKYIWHPNQRGV